MTSTLSKLAENFSAELLIAAVQVGKWTPEKSFFYAMQMQPRQKVETLVKLVEVLPKHLRLQALQAVLQTAEFIRDEQYLVETLSNLVPQLSTDILPEVWKVVRTLEDEKFMAQALTALAPKLTPDWLTEALETALDLNYYRVETLEQLAPYLKTSSLLPMALTAIEKIQDGEERDEALKILIPYLYPDLQTQALEIALRTWHFSSGMMYASEALTKLAPQLSPELLSQALESARNLSYREIYRSSPELLEYLEAKGRSVDDKPYYAAYSEILEVLAPFLTLELRKVALKVAIDSLSGERLAQVLVTLVLYLPSALETALIAVRSLRGCSSEKENIIRAKYLVRLACNLPVELASYQPALLQEALTATLRVAPVNIFHLLELLPHLPEALPHALKACQSLNDRYSYAFISSLIPYVNLEQLPVVLSIINSSVGEHMRPYALSELVPQHPTVLSLALDSALELKDESRTKSLKELFSKLASEHSHHILTTAHELSAERLQSHNCADILVALAPKLTETLLPEAVEVALNIQKFEHRDRALVALAIHQPIMFPSALLVAKSKHGFVISELQMEKDSQDSDFLSMVVSLSIEGWAEKVEALLALIPYFPAALSFALNKLIETGGGDTFSANALLQLAPHLDAIPHLTADSITQALGVAQKIINKDERLQALKEFVRHLNINLLSQVLDIALKIEDENYRIQVLIALVPRLKIDIDLLSKVLGSSLLMKTDSHRAALLTALAPYLPSSVNYALEATSIMGDKYHYAQTLTALSKDSYEIASQALEVVLSIDEDFYRAKALTSLIPILPENLLFKVQDFVASLKEYKNYDAAFAELAFRLPETTNYALEAVLTQRRWSNLEIFTQLVPHLSRSLIQKILPSINKIDYLPKRAEVITVLVAYAKGTVPEVLESILETISSPSLDDPDRAETLMKIAPHLSVNHLQKALEIIRPIRFKHYQAFILRALSPQLIQTTDEMFQALEIVEDYKKLSDPFARDLYYTFVLTALKPELTENLMVSIPRILESSWFWAFIPHDCIQFLKELLPYMTVEQRLVLLEAVESLDNQPEQIYGRGHLPHVLPILISNLPEEHLSKALTAVRSVKSISDKVEVLTTLAPRLDNDLLFEALEIVYSQFARSQDYDYVQVINVLAPYLRTSKLLNKALEDVSFFNYENTFYRAEALAALVSAKSEAGAKAVEAVLSLDKNRAGILKKLSPYLAQTPQSSSLWKTTLHALSQYPRPDFLQDLAALVPFVSALVEQPVTDSLARSITDVVRWWP